MYDPTIGRWTTEDPDGFTPGDPNLYRYVENDPTNLTDPSGLAPPGTVLVDPDVAAFYQAIGQKIPTDGKHPLSRYRLPPGYARPVVALSPFRPRRYTQLLLSQPGIGIQGTTGPAAVGPGWHETFKGSGVFIGPPRAIKPPATLGRPRTQVIVEVKDGKLPWDKNPKLFPKDLFDPKKVRDNRIDLLFLYIDTDKRNVSFSSLTDKAAESMALQLQKYRMEHGGKDMIPAKDLRDIALGIAGQTFMDKYVEWKTPTEMFQSLRQFFGLSADVHSVKEVNPETLTFWGPEGWMGAPPGPIGKFSTNWDVDLLNPSVKGQYTYKNQGWKIDFNGEVGYDLSAALGSGFRAFSGTTAHHSRVSWGVGVNVIWLRPLPKK